MIIFLLANHAPEMIYHFLSTSENDDDVIMLKQKFIGGAVNVDAAVKQPCGSHLPPLTSLW